MTLKNLKTALQGAKSTLFELVFFDYGDVLNTNVDKAYPYILWDIGNVTGSTLLRSTEKELELTLYGVNEFDPEMQDILEVWDGIETNLKAYLILVNALTSISVLSDSLTIEYYQRGLISVDSEVGVSFKVRLRLWC